MRKTLFLLLVFLLLGCTKIEKNNLDYIEYYNLSINNKKLSNNNSKGFKFYLPKGVIINKNMNNNIILLSENTKMYLYVDVIGYYYKKSIIDIEENNYDYFKKIKDNGYLIVDENNGKYYIKINSNYSTIEFYSNKRDIPRLILLSSIILNNIEFNDKIIKNEIDNYLITNNDKLYEIEELDKNENSFSDYLNEYVEEPDEKIELPD